MPLLDTLVSQSPEVLAVGAVVLVGLSMFVHDRAVSSSTVPVSQPRKNGRYDKTPWRKTVELVLLALTIGLILFAVLGVNSVL